MSAGAISTSPGVCSWMPHELAVAVSTADVEEVVRSKGEVKEENHHVW